MAAGGGGGRRAGAPSLLLPALLHIQLLAFFPYLQWRMMGHAMVDFIADYQAGIEQMPVRSQVQPGYLR